MFTVLEMASNNATQEEERVARYDEENGQDLMTNGSKSAAAGSEDERF